VAKASRLAPAQLRALDRLKRSRAVRDFYLAGGSGLAVHLGHRRSTDLDLFSASEAVDLEPLRRLIRREKFPVTAESDVTLSLSVGRTPVDVVRYPYPLLEPPVPGPHGFPVAGLRDIAAMKLSAIARRGLRRDFWDLAEILDSGLTLRDCADAYLAKFGRSQSDLYAVLRALTWFDDAEAQALWPAGLTEKHWRDIKRRVTEAAVSLGAELSGLQAEGDKPASKRGAPKRGRRD
jgi:hypothetical protein